MFGFLCDHASVSEYVQVYENQSFWNGCISALNASQEIAVVRYIVLFGPTLPRKSKMKNAAKGGKKTYLGGLGRVLKNNEVSKCN